MRFAALLVAGTFVLTATVAPASDATSDLAGLTHLHSHRPVVRSMSGMRLSTAQRADSRVLVFGARGWDVHEDADVVDAGLSAS